MTPPVGASRAVMVARQIAEPDSGIHQYLKADFTSSNWPDNIGTSDIDTITGLTYDNNAFDGDGGVFGDGTDDYGQSDTMGSFGSNMGSDFAISVPIDTSDDNSAVFGLINTNDATLLILYLGDVFDVGWPAGAPTFAVGDANGNNLVESADTAVNDGVPHHILINKTGNTADDINFYIDDMTTAAGSTNQSDEGFSNPSDFDVPMTYFARNNENTIEMNYNGYLGDVTWFNSSLSQSERLYVHRSLAWT